MTNYWFVIHDIMAYQQHNDMICCKARSTESKIRRPRMPSFKKMELGDEILYYAAGSYVFIGIFKVTSHSEYFSDELWEDVFVRKIEPLIMPPRGKYPHIKKILFESDYKFDIFPIPDLWHATLRGKTLRKISKSDFEKFSQCFDNKKFLVTEDEIKIPITVWQKNNRKKDV